MFLREIQATFAQSSNAEKKIQMENYMKNKFHFYGIPSPLRKELSKQFYPKFSKYSIKEILETASSLWTLQQRELQYFAMDLLIKHKRKLGADHLKIGESFIINKSWWDTVDLISTHYFGTIMSKMEYKDQKSYVEYLAGHDNMWMNRVAMIYQLKYKEKTNTEFLEIAILPHLESKEFFHKKAIGWALRQYSKYNSAYVSMFLEEYELSNLSRREASKYL